MLTDTHCHIHQTDYSLDRTEVLRRAMGAEVTRMICVGTDEESSMEAVGFAAAHTGVFASVGVHPHEARRGWSKIDALAGGAGIERPVAVGEIGLDYFYGHSLREAQIEAFQAQIEIALKHRLPVIFHVRDAFDDFWPVFDNFSGVRGVLHSFTDTAATLERALSRGLYIGVNGISTFTKNEAQREMFRNIPLDRLLLETDAPFLTPVPFRGKVNEPAYVREITQHQANIRNVSFDEIAAVSTANAEALFAL